MPPVNKVIEVLITGFGAFRGYDDNPSWLAVRNLHGTRLDLSKEPSYEPGKGSDNPSSLTTSTDIGQVAHIQCVHVPVHYGTILDTIPRLHGSEKPYSPQAERWFDDRCDSTGLAGEKDKYYPDGYRIKHPDEGFDVIIHVGVGRSGGIRVETLGHKIGYKHGDTKEDLAPELPLTGETSPENGSTQVEYDPSVANEELVKDGKLRGFGEGYETYGLEERTDVDVPGLVEWLRQKGMGVEDVCQSEDAGRYLCDFIFYCSLCEAKRRAEQGAKKATVQFIHVPPIDKDLSTEACTAAIRCIAWRLASKRNGSS